jgi:PIN domain nuclease of toxin-antitoxin system
MRLLLDTHAFLWFVTNDPQLSATAKTLIADPGNVILV